MGHVESGGETTGARRPGLSLPRIRARSFWRAGDPPHPVWPLWWALKKEFALWRAPASWIGTPGSWTYFGNDFVTGLRRNASTTRAFALLEASPEQFDRVQALGALNLRRHEAMFQFVALLYVSVPVTIILGLAEVMPESLIEMFRANPMPIWQLVGAFTVGVGVYLIGLWRARQLMAVLELWRIERLQGPPKA